MSEKSRASFEAWAIQPPREFDIAIHGDSGAWPGGYKSYPVQCAWESWQAAQTLPAVVDWRKPISNFGAADAFTIEPHTDDVFSAYQQGIRFAERRHGINAAPVPSATPDTSSVKQGGAA